MRSLAAKLTEKLSDSCRERVWGDLIKLPNSKQDKKKKIKKSHTHRLVGSQDHLVPRLLKAKF